LDKWPGPPSVLQTSVPLISFLVIESRTGSTDILPVKHGIYTAQFSLRVINDALHHIMTRQSEFRAVENRVLEVKK
jgi:hypothetical protein